MTETPIPGALAGIKVVDLSRILAGPWATQMLADFGADVIKIERPGRGDDTRSWGPPFFEAPDSDPVAAYFHSANRGKRSLAVDITQPPGQEVVRSLVREADVLVENFKVDGLKKYGLDYESLKVVNPRLVYCSITGFGQTGPYRHRSGYDFMIQAMGGLMSLTGEPDGMPMKVGVALADILTGLYSANAIQAALLYRNQTNRGQHIDMSLLDVQVASLANQSMNYLASGDSPERLGNAHPNIVPYQAFATADGSIVIAVGNDSQFQRFCDLCQRPELATDERFRTNQARVAHREVLIPIITAIIQTQPTVWWLHELEKIAVPCGPINTIADVFADEQVQHRGLSLTLKHDAYGELPSVGNPIKFSESAIEYSRASPALGEDTTDILADQLGYNADYIEHLRMNGVIS